MTVELVTSPLLNAIEAWYEQLIAAASTQTYSDVQSALQNICLEALVGFDALPKPLRELHEDIVNEFANRGRGSYPAPNLVTAKLMTIVENALEL